MQPYTHFTLEERDSLRVKLQENKSLRTISKELGRNVSSISRELKRNKNKNGTYNAWRGCTLYIIRRKQSKKKFRLEAEQGLKGWVMECMDKYWSPEIITAVWKKKNPNAKLSHSTIYAALRAGRLEGYSPKNHLRRRGRRKNSHQSATIHPEHMIRDWPKEIRDRIRIGDWEGDTVYGAIGKGLLLTCVDRSARFLAASLLEKRTGNLTRQAVKKALHGLPVNSLSLDNGSEFSDFKEIEKDLDTTVYFADPHSPWQRGSNENVNDLIRFFFPKGTNFHEVTDDMVKQVVDLINHRPRKCLGWLSPADVFFSKCCT